MKVDVQKITKVLQFLDFG